MAKQELENGFKLADRLEADSTFITSLNLCDVRLIGNAHYLWFLLVPRRADVTELHQLPTDDQTELLKEINMLSYTLNKLDSFDKLNVGALGNVVPQLHIHVIGRKKTDPAWPGPVWGHEALKAYTDNEKTKLIANVKNLLQAN